MYKNIIVVFILLCSTSWFQFFPESISNATQLLGIATILGVLPLMAVYEKGFMFRKHFNVEILLFLGSVLLSMFGAYYYHKQDFSITIVVQRFMYYYFFYYLLHLLKPKPFDLLRIVLYLFVVYSIIYIIQYTVYPVSITNAKKFIDRGTLRIFMPGAVFLVLGYFISLSQLFVTKKTKYAIFCLMALLIFVMLGTRQLLASIFLLTFLYIYQSKVIRSKILMFFLIVVSLVPVYFIFESVFMAMFEVTVSQTEDPDDYIRVRAAIFFLFEFFPNSLSYITGNGVASNHSAYGKIVDMYMEVFGFYQSDVGIVGDFSKFGALFAIAEISILVRFAIMKLPESLLFIKYFFLIVLLTIVTGAPVFGSADSIAAICMMLYLTDVHLTTKDTPGLYPVI